MNPGGKPPRIVVDTNVLFFAIALPKESPPFRVLELCRSGKASAFVSPFILGELEKNLAGKVRWDENRLRDLRKKLLGFLQVIEPASRIDVIKSCEADNRILECAVDARAEALVTGNMKDLRPLGAFRGIEILTPREFLDKFSPS